jgi:hypothetical protein
MRVRVSETPKGAIDGIRLDRLHVGVTYDLPSSLACCLVAEGWAEPEPPGTVQRDGFSSRLRAEFAGERMATAADRHRKPR